MKGASLTALVLVFVLAVLGLTVAFTFLHPSKKLFGKITVDGSKTLVVSEISASRKSRFLSVADSLFFRFDSLAKVSKPIMGYRFCIVGNFDSDQIADTLVECYTDSLLKTEVAKYDEVYEYADVLYRAGYYNYQSFMKVKGKSDIAHLPGAFLGFSYVENCGDLNGDRRDEVFCVKNHGGYSNVTTGYFYTLTDTGWAELNRTGVWLWMFPPTPGAAMVSSMFGAFEFGYTGSDSMDIALEKQLKEFQYVVRKGKCAVEFECMSFLEMDEALDEDDYYKKRFKKTKTGNEIFLTDQYYKALSYPASVLNMTGDDKGNYILPINDGASSLLVRVNTCSPESPFRLRKSFNKVWLQ